MKRIAHIIDPNGNVITDGLVYSAYVAARVLAATTAEVHTIPTGAKNVRFTGTVPFFINFGAAAAIPAADITDGTASLLILTGRIFAIPSGVTTIGLIASANCTVTMEFYT